MISHIEGRVAEKRAGELVIDVNGVGFLLLCPASTIAAAPAAGETFRCYTHFSVYDGGMDLYGFSSKEDREMFRRLCSVSGIGARTALGILSTLSLRDLSLAILTGEDATTIEDVYEPYLLQLGFIMRTPRGRVVTEAAYKHMKIAPPVRAALDGQIRMQLD